jgi:putative restriction endonuclease
MHWQPRKGPANRSQRRASEIWKVLIARALGKLTITHGELASEIHFNGANLLAYPLDCIALYCRQKDLPPLTVLTVNRDSGKTGVGWFKANPGSDPNAERERVFNFDWFGIVPPTPEELRQAHQAGRPLPE